MKVASGPCKAAHLSPTAVPSKLAFFCLITVAREGVGMRGRQSLWTYHAWPGFPVLHEDLPGLVTGQMSVAATPHRAGFSGVF